MRPLATFRDAVFQRLRTFVQRPRLAAVAALAAAALTAGLVATMSAQRGARRLRPTRPSGLAAAAASSADAWPLEPWRAATAPPAGRPVTVRIDLKRPRAAVPADFLGISFESVALPRIAASVGGGVLVRLLRSLGDGRLRFGGVSADARVAFSQQGERPRWASGAVSAHDLAGLAALARLTGWSVLLTVNLGHYDPVAAAREAAAARALLGVKLAGIEIGNEPDRFALKGLRTPGWNFSAYSRQAYAYRTAIARAAPGVPIAGPDASSGEPVLPWVRAAAALRPALLTDHYYPLTSCGSTPLVSELLSPALRQEESAMLSRLVSIQRASAIPLLIDETNNISCKGEPGVSNSFASALWAVDYVTRAMAAGVRGLDFHDLIRRADGYSPLVATASGLHANPEWYALLLAQRLRGARPLRATTPLDANLSAGAFLRAHGIVQLALVNFEAPGRAPLRVQVLPGGRFVGGSILRLRGPSPYATSHVRLGARAVTASGAWSPRLPLPGLYRTSSGSLALAMPPCSAALVTLEPAARR